MLYCRGDQLLAANHMDSMEMVKLGCQNSETPEPTVANLAGVITSATRLHMLNFKPISVGRPGRASSQQIGRPGLRHHYRVVIVFLPFWTPNFARVPRLNRRTDFYVVYESCHRSIPGYCIFLFRSEIKLQSFRFPLFLPPGPHNTPKRGVNRHFQDYPASMLTLGQRYYRHVKRRRWQVNIGSTLVQCRKTGWQTVGSWLVNGAVNAPTNSPNIY